MNEEEYSIERLRAVVSRMKKYRRRALIYACVTAALVIMAAIVHPYVKALANEKFVVWPAYVYVLALKVPRYIVVTLCAMSVISALWDRGIKIKWLRLTLLILGVVLSTFYIYSLSLTFINFLPRLPGRLWLISY